MTPQKTKLIIVSLLAFLHVTPGFAEHKPVLNIYSWAGYLPEVVLKQFTEETGIQINYNTYESNEAMYVKLKHTPQNRYDIVIPSSYTVHRMIQENMLQPIDLKQISHLKSVNPQFLNQAYDPGNQYSVPFLFSATGIVINHKKYTLSTWKELWETRWKKQLLLLDDLREVFAIGLLALGFSPNTQESKEIEQAYTQLQSLFPNIRVFNSEGLVSLYADEDLKIGMGWSGEIYHAQKRNPNIRFIYPEEGYPLNIDSLVIPRNAKHAQAAHQFIDFLLRPEIAAKITILTGYSSTSEQVASYLPEEIASNPTIYPDAETLKRGIILTSLGSKHQEYEKYWNLLKA